MQVWIWTEITLGKAVTRDLAAIGVQNKFDRMMFSSSTLCSFSTAIAFITVFPVPICVINKIHYNLLSTQWQIIFSIVSILFNTHSLLDTSIRPFSRIYHLGI